MRLKLVLLVVIVLGVAIWLFSPRDKTQEAKAIIPQTPPATWTLHGAAQPYSGTTIRLIGEDYPPLQAIDKIKPQFERETGITVDIEKYESQTVLQKVALDLSQKSARYDLIVQVYFDMGRLATNGQIRPLNKFTADQRLNDPSLQIDQDLFPMWSSMSKYQGIQYGYPMMVLTMYTWYRKDLFENATERKKFLEAYHYELAPPRDWKQYRDMAEFFTRPNQGLYGTLIQGKRHMALWQEYLNFLYSFGGSIMDTRDSSTYGRVVLNSPEAIEATKYYKGLLKFAPPDSLNFTWDDALALTQQGKVAMCLMWNDSTYALEDPKLSKVNGRMGYAMMPRGKDGRLTHQVGGQSYYIPTGAQHAEAAFLFMQWLLQKNQQIAQQKLGGSSPRQSTYEDPDVKALPWTKASQDAFANTHPAMLYTVPESLQIGDVIKSSLSEILASQKTVEAGIKDAADEIQRLVGKKSDEVRK